MPLRIVHACPFFDPATEYGGPVRQLRAVCGGLARRGHDVRVVTSDLGLRGAHPVERWVERDGFRVWYGRAGRAGAFAPYYAPRLAGPLRDALDDADVLHLALSFTHLNVLAGRIARAAGVPYVYTPRSCLDPVRLEQRPRAKRLFLAAFERRVMRDAAAVHALTDAERGQVARVVPGLRTMVVPNTCSLAGRRAWPDPAPFRRAHDLDPSASVVLFLGRLQRIKGLDLLVRAFAAARRAEPAAVLVVAGPDEGGRDIVLAEASRAGVLDAVRLVGVVDGEERLAALRAADVFALTSRSEGMSNAVLEACAAARPVLITEGCHLPEIALSRAGIVAPPRAGRLGVALTELLRLGPAERAAMGERGRALVESRFALSPVLDAIEAMYDEILHPDPARALPAATEPPLPASRAA